MFPSRMNWVRRFAFATLVALIVLIFVGAIVRVTGSGMGCPDWPRCWGCLIPPTSVEQVDFENLDLERFKKKAERHGRDPDTITHESLRAEFNPKHTWIEFFNRLCSLPVGFFVMSLLVAAMRARSQEGGGKALLLSIICVLLVGANALMGARVVYSGLSPGIITLHWALAFLLLCLLVVLCHSGKKVTVGKGSFVLSWSLFAMTVAEALMGSQVREKTDALQKLHANVARKEWTYELEHSFIYLTHRSFSWLIFAAAVALWFMVGKLKKVGQGGAMERPLEIKAITALVFLMMLMGLAFSFSGIHSVIQVAHVGLTGVLMAVLLNWCLSLRR